MADLQALEAAVKAAGDKVRQVKADKGDIKPVLEELVAAKASFKGQRYGRAVTYRCHVMQTFI